MARPSLLRIDWVVLLSAICIAVTGLLFLHSASPASFQKQILFLAVGLVALVMALLVDYEVLLDHAYALYAVVLVLLLVVFLQPPINHAYSWIRIPGVPFNIQPSELMKPAMILALAAYLRHRESQSRAIGLIPPFLLTLVPMAMILKQPDLGSAILLPPVLFAVVFASGARVTHLAAVGFSGAACTVPMWMFVMKSFQKRRILAWLDPEQFETREAFQLTMSLIAIGSGGLYGEGLGQGTSNALDLLPEKHNDFIFGVIAEEGGFVVAAALLLLYMVMVLSGFHIAFNAREPGARLVATGCAAMLGTQVLINIGVVTAVLPTTGITLPLVSYGGSSLIVSLTLVGLLLNVGARRPIVLTETFRGRTREA